MANNDSFWKKISRKNIRDNYRQIETYKPKKNIGEIEINSIPNYAKPKSNKSIENLLKTIESHIFQKKNFFSVKKSKYSLSNLDINPAFDTTTYSNLDLIFDNQKGKYESGNLNELVKDIEISLPTNYFSKVKKVQRGKINWHKIANKYFLCSDDIYMEVKKDDNENIIKINGLEGKFKVSQGAISYEGYKKINYPTDTIKILKAYQTLEVYKPFLLLLNKSKWLSSNDIIQIPSTKKMPINDVKKLPNY